jgi:hypothetical protein
MQLRQARPSITLTTTGQKAITAAQQWMDGVLTLHFSVL